MDRRAFFFLFSVWVVSSGAFLFGPGVAGSGVFPGFPLDDTYIHFSFARNLADHLCFGLNPGEWSSGSTSPLWVLLLAIFAKATGAIAVSALMLGALFIFLTALAVYRLVVLETGETRPAFYAAFFSLITGRFLWGGFSGMEIPLFAFLMTAALIVHRRAVEEGRISFYSSFLFGLASLARPEGYLLFALAVIDVARRARGGLKGTVLRMSGYLGLYAALVVPYAALNLALTGRVFCSSYYAKMLLTWWLNPVSYLAGFFHYFFADNPILFFLAFPGAAWLLAKRRSLWGAWLVIFPLVAAFKAPILFHHGRYMMPLIPLYIAAGFVGWGLLKKAAVRNVFLGLALGLALWGHGARAGIFAFDALSIRRLNIAAARWVRENVPGAEAVATNDIGAISYFSGHRVVDLCGLAFPDILRIHEMRRDVLTRHRVLRDYLLSRGVRYLVLGADSLALVLKDSPYRRIHAIYYPFNTIAGSNKMEVYKIP